VCVCVCVNWHTPATGHVNKPAPEPTPRGLFLQNVCAITSEKQQQQPQRVKSSSSSTANRSCSGGACVQPWRKEGKSCSAACHHERTKERVHSVFRRTMTPVFRHTGAQVCCVASLGGLRSLQNAMSAPSSSCPTEPELPLSVSFFEMLFVALLASQS